MVRRLSVLALALATTLGCESLDEARDVRGNFELTYQDSLRIYLNNDLIAEVSPGEEASIEHNGQSFELEAVCGDDGTQCPSEAFWREMGVDQPLGTGNKLLNFINLDAERGQPGQRLAGLMQNNGSFEMLAGIGLDGNENCAVIGVAKVLGSFDGAGHIDAATIVYEWGAGCEIAGTTLAGSLRIETDVKGERTGGLDLGSLQTEPIDENGEPIDKEDDEASE